MEIELHIDAKDIDYLIRPENDEEAAINKLLLNRYHFTAKVNNDGDIRISKQNMKKEGE